MKLSDYTGRQRASFIAAAFLIATSTAVFNGGKPLWIEAISFVMISVVWTGIVYAFYRCGWWRAGLALVWWIVLGDIAGQTHLSGIGDVVYLGSLFIPAAWLRARKPSDTNGTRVPQP